jgi:hypothetical protein
MKSERRHELKENELAHAFSVARAYLDENGKQVGIVVVIVGAVVAAVAFGVRSRAAAIEDVWRRKAQLQFEDLEVGRESLSTLASMLQDVTDERFVFSGLVEQGQQAMRLAQQVPDPPDGELTQKAREAFEQLLGRFADNPLAVGIAYTGLATVEENEFTLDGDLVHKEKADAYLLKIIETEALNAFPFMRLAMDRRKALGETFTRVEFEYPTLPEEPPAPSPDRSAVIDESTETTDRADPVDDVSSALPETSGDEAREPVDRATPDVDASDSDSGDGEPNDADAPSLEPNGTP